jgi:hypothetical protein
MKIHTKLVYQWDDSIGWYKLISDESFEYRGPVDMVCGASAAQLQLQGQQMGFATQVANQAGTIFGKDSSVFNALTGSLLPTIAKGPNAPGFSAGELAARNAGVITTGAQAAANSRSALGNAAASQGGGNTGLTAGATSVNEANTTADIAQGTASELNKVQEQNYEVGRQEYNEAIKGAEGAGEVFNSATSAAGAADSAFKGAATTANEITAENQSWQNAAIGALGGVAGAATGGLMKNFAAQNTPTPSGNGTYEPGVDDVGSGISGAP